MRPATKRLIVRFDTWKKSFIPALEKAGIATQANLDKMMGLENARDVIEVTTLLAVTNGTYKIPLTQARFDKISEERFAADADRLAHLKNILVCLHKTEIMLSDTIIERLLDKNAEQLCALKTTIEIFLNNNLTTYLEKVLMSNQDIPLLARVTDKLSALGVLDCAAQNVLELDNAKLTLLDTTLPTLCEDRMRDYRAPFASFLTTRAALFTNDNITAFLNSPEPALFFQKFDQKPQQEKEKNTCDALLNGIVNRYSEVKKLAGFFSRSSNDSLAILKAFESYSKSATKDISLFRQAIAGKKAGKRLKTILNENNEYRNNALVKEVLEPHTALKR